MEGRRRERGRKRRIEKFFDCLLLILLTLAMALVVSGKGFAHFYVMKCDKMSSL